MCGFMCLFLFLYVSVWDESMTCSSSLVFFVLFFSSPWLWTSLLCVCEYSADPPLLPTAPSITVSSLHTCGIFLIFASFYTFLYVCVCVCLYVNQPGGRAPEPSLWSRRWQPAAPGRNPPAGWNVGEKLSGGRIVVGRWGQEHATRASSRSFSEHHSMRRLVFFFCFLFFRESEFDHSVSRKCREDPVWWSVNRRPTGNPPSFPFRQWNVIFDTAVILQFTVCGHCGCEEGNTATIWSHHRVLCWSYVGLNIVLFFLKEEKVWGGSFSSKPQKSNLGSSSKIHEPTQLL